MAYYDHGAALRKKKAAEEFEKLKRYLSQKSHPQVKSDFKFVPGDGKLKTAKLSEADIAERDEKEKTERVDLRSIDLGAALDHIRSLENELAETTKELTEQNNILSAFDALLDRKHKRHSRDPLNTPLI